MGRGVVEETVITTTVTMTGLAQPGQPGVCPTCGAAEYHRVDVASRATCLQIVNVWADGYAGRDDDSGDWEPADIAFGTWACSQGHPVTKAFGEVLDAALDDVDSRGVLVTEGV